MTKIYRLYLELLKKYGKPKPWPWQEDSIPSSPFEICVGAILTQNTNWQNVEKAIGNLKKAKVLTVEKLRTMPCGKVEELIKPSGFYRQKAERLQIFCRHLGQKYRGKMEKLWEKELVELRQELLSLKGVGPETADTMILYAGKKPIFVIDEYTRRFAKRHRLTQDFSYKNLQKLFMKNLPKNVKIYEDLHALIVKDGKMSK